MDYPYTCLLCGRVFRFDRLGAALPPHSPDPTREPVPVVCFGSGSQGFALPPELRFSRRTQSA